METKQLFKIFDSCEPTVDQVKRYLGLISGSSRSEFDLVFIKGEKRIVTRDLKRGLGELEGIVIDGKIFFAKGLDWEDLCKKESITTLDVLVAATAFHPGARPMERQKPFFSLLNKAGEYLELAETLNYLGYSVMTQEKLLLVGKYSASFTAETVPFGAFGSCQDVDIAKFLKEGGKILMYADFK